MQRSSLELELDRDIASARERLLDDLGSPLAKKGFGPKDFAETYLVFERRYIPAIAWALAVILFPIGLLFLIFMRSTATLFFDFDNASDGTRLRIDGQAPRGVWAMVREWGASPMPRYQPLGAVAFASHLGDKLIQRLDPNRQLDF